MGLLCTQRSKRSALVKKKGTESATNSCYGNKKHVMFLKLRPELYISLYICSLSSYPKLYYSWPRWHLQYERKTTGYKTEKTKKPGKRFVLIVIKQMQTESASTVSSNPGCWTRHLASACNCSTVTSSKFLFLTTSTSWQKMFSSTLTPCNKKKICKVAIVFTMLNRRNREHNLYDRFHQQE